MAGGKLTIITETDKQSLPAEIRIESEFLARLKPFLASCMKLNYDWSNPLAGVTGCITSDSIPISNHEIRIVHNPFNDTLGRNVSVLPHSSLRHVDLLASAFLSSWGYASEILRPMGVRLVSNNNTGNCSAGWRFVDEVPSDGDDSFLKGEGVRGARIPTPRKTVPSVQKQSTAWKSTSGPGISGHALPSERTSWYTKAVKSTFQAATPPD